jgi:anti-sigma B factor antagonist
MRSERPEHDAHEPSPADPIVTVRRSGERAIVTLSGELDAEVEAEVTRTINQAVALPGLTALRLDTTRVTFMDSSGLRLLVISGQLAGDHGVELSVVVTEGGPVARLIELTGLDRALPILSVRSAT